MPKQALDVRQAHRLLSPGPVTLLTSLYRGQPNVMTAGLVTTVALDPPLVGVAIHPTRLTHEFVSKSDQFALNLPPIDLIAAVQQAGLVSGRDGDKFVALGLTPADAAEVDAPLVAECLGHLECGVVERVRLGDHDLFVGQILAAAADDAAFDTTWKAGEEGAPLLHHLGENLYAALGKGYRA
jgi:flavin reductase (DIM6/NTAB) family NADH-FMN oxidoreductase RutF